MHSADTHPRYLQNRRLIRLIAILIGRAYFFAETVDQYGFAITFDMPENPAIT